MCISRGVSEPCRPTRVISYGKSFELISAQLSCAATTTSPRRSRTLRVDGAEPAARDRLVAGQHRRPGRRGRSARWPARRRPHRRGSRRAGTAPRHRAGPPRRAAPVLVDVDVVSAGRVDHPVVGDDQQPHLVGQRVAQLLDVLVDVAQLGPPALRVDARAVTVPVEVAVVDVGEGRPPRGPATAPGDPLADVVGADELRTPLAAPGQPGAGELALADHAGVHARRLEPGERGALRLPLQRVDRLVPEQRVRAARRSPAPAR